MVMYASFISLIVDTFPQITDFQIVRPGLNVGYRASLNLETTSSTIRVAMVCVSICGIGKHSVHLV